MTAETGKYCNKSISLSFLNQTFSNYLLLFHFQICKIHKDQRIFFLGLSFNDILQQHYINILLMS